MMRSLAIAFVLATVSGCSPPSNREPASVARPEEVLDFGVYWPPQDPEAPEGPAGEPLLLGELQVCRATSTQGNETYTASLKLTRHDDEEHRETWNSQLAYREYGWMRRLRVWDVDEKWL